MRHNMRNGHNFSQLRKTNVPQNPHCHHCTRLFSAAVWTFAPELLLTLWDRDLTSSARSAISSSFGIDYLMLATLGFFELVTRHLNPGVLATALVEIMLGSAFLFVARIHKELTQSASPPSHQILHSK